eukprot:272622-Chlamydomonas_euryale.AAC.17
MEGGGMAGKCSFIVAGHPATIAPQKLHLPLASYPPTIALPTPVTACPPCVADLPAGQPRTHRVRSLVRSASYSLACSCVFGVTTLDSAASASRMDPCCCPAGSRGPGCPGGIHAHRIAVLLHVAGGGVLRRLFLESARVTLASSVSYTHLTLPTILLV